jgi:hypothetical protein
MSRTYITEERLTPPELIVVYDLRDPAAWQTACDHGRTWGRLYADIHTLDDSHIAVVFRGGGDRWQAWEQKRLEWILGNDFGRCVA